MRVKILVVAYIALFLFNQNVKSQSKTKSGDYYYKVGTYDRALRSYKRALRNNKDKISLYVKIIDCYINSNLDKNEAYKYIDKLLVKERNSENVFKHGQILFYTMKFDQASLEFEWVKIHEEQDSKLYKESLRYLNWILNANALIENPLDVEFINLGKSINTNKSELNPFVTETDDVLLFSSNKRYLSQIGANYFNVCITKRESNNWQKSKTLGNNINSKFDEIVAGCSPEGNPLFVFHNRNGSEKVGHSEKDEKGRFSTLQEFGYPIDKKGGEFGVWLSHTRDTLVFASSNADGNTDIFYALKLPDGSYGEPRSISDNINSNFDENFPVMARNGKRIYFSSNSDLSMGGYDLFYSDWNDENKSWNSPVNLGYPINDVNDNYTISMPKGKRYAYVSAIKPEGIGERDIYKVLYKSEAPDHLILRCKVVLETDTGKITPEFSLKAELKNSLTNTIEGTYRLSYDSAKFVMAVTPGKYELTFIREGSIVFKTPLVVPEMKYSTEPVNKEFIIPKQEENHL